MLCDTLFELQEDRQLEQYVQKVDMLLRITGDRQACDTE